MLLSRFFSQAIMSRTIRYAIPATLGISLLELLTVIGGMPITIPISRMTALWVLTWPTFAQALLPLCFCLAILITAVQLADTQELAILQLYMQPKDWRRCIAKPVMLFFTCMLVLTCWINPMTKGAYLSTASSILQSVEVPTLIPGQFKYLNLTNEPMVAFPSQQGHNLLFLAWEDSSLRNDMTLLNIVQAESISIDNAPEYAVLCFNNAHGYSFRKRHHLENTMSFKKLCTPLKSPSGWMDDGDLTTKSISKLFHETWLAKTGSGKNDTDSPSPIDEIIWRIQLPFAVVILAWSSLVLIDYRYCRDHRNRFYATAGTLAILYFITILIAKRGVGSLQSNMLVTLCFICIHTIAVVLSYVLRRSRLLKLA